MNWTAIESLATVVSAFVTATMAWMTYRTIAQTRKHHKDEYRPILSLAPNGAADPVRRENLLAIEPPQPQSPDRYYRAHGVLNNIGRGPALNVMLTMRFLGVEGYGFNTEIAPVGAGDRLDFSEQPLRLLARFRDGFNDTDFQLGPGSDWEILIEYDDVFGQRFHTVHTKNPQQPWTVIGRGPAPQGRDPRLIAEQMQAMAQVHIADKPISLSDR